MRRVGLAEHSRKLGSSPDNRRDRAMKKRPLGRHCRKSHCQGSKANLYCLPRKCITGRQIAAFRSDEWGVKDQGNRAGGQ
jgi:hypothetical protein